MRLLVLMFLFSCSHASNINNNFNLVPQLHRLNSTVIYVAPDTALIPAVIFASSRWYNATGINIKIRYFFGDLPIQLSAYVIVDGQLCRGATHYHGSKPIKVLIEYGRFFEGMEPTVRTMTHEFGHVLGHHYHEPDSIMMISTKKDVKITAEVIKKVCSINNCLWQRPE